ncbi:MAG: sugar phosphate isomerase/epimerase [Defluviitaleaceae bacterium]|nr:sugar phosphate isomerase/epimerase [Defluviitaleaceae bacterium]
MKYGAQLHTIRDYMQTHKDFASSIKKISKLGFKCVQVSGVNPIIPPEEIGETCQAYGLEVVISHADPARILNNTEDVIKEHKYMNASYVGIGQIPKEYSRDQTGYRQFITDYIPASRELKKEGLQLMYHNHHFEFEKLGEKHAIDYIKDNFKDVNFTLDTYWVQMAGADPAFWINRLKGRVEILHLKDCEVNNGISRMCEVMEGNMNWPYIIAAARASGIKYAFVEQDECFGKDPFDCLATSLNNLQNKL